MGSLIALLCLSGQASGIVPTKDVETPFMFLKALTVVSQSHSSQWSHGVFAIRCDYTSTKTKDDLYANLTKGFSKYLVLPERSKSGTAGWRIRVDGIDYRFRFETVVESVKKIDGAVTRLVIEEHPHLRMEISVPIYGVAPKRWWKQAVFGDSVDTEFELDHSIKAVSGSVDEERGYYTAYLDGSPKDWNSYLRPKLVSAGFKANKGGSAGYYFRSTKQGMYQVIIGKVRNGANSFDLNHTSVQWFTRSLPRL